jgi:exosortase
MQESAHSITSESPKKAGLRALFGAFSFQRLCRGALLSVIALGACWLLFFNELRGEWQINAQYNYGYVVPLLGIALFWRRWPERPNATSRKHMGLVVAVTAGLLVLMLPSRVILEANPEWRLIYWINGFQLLALSAGFLYYLGGWSWVTFFAPPLAFMLIAIPWPMALEQAIIQGLMRLVAGLTVGVADWLGIPAVQHGNLVEVGAGVVGIDEACSVVRSVQSALMLSLFLGEMYRFSVVRRLSLILGSLLFVLLANLTRTTFLVWAAANRGLQQMESWHNTAGNLVMFIVLPGLMLLAYLMKPKVERRIRERTSQPQALDIMPRWVGIGVMIWLGLAEASSEAWYRMHESNLVANNRWSVSWPTQAAQFRQSEVPERSLAILRCSQSEAASWLDEEGTLWSAFFLRWAPGKNSAQLSKGHRPDICFPAAGAHMVADVGQVVLSANGLEIPFRHETFENEGGLFHVFYCLWADRVSSDEKVLLEDGSQASRLRAVLAGKRHLGQQVLEIVIHAAESNDEAVRLLGKQLPGLVHRDPAAHS